MKKHTHLSLDERITIAQLLKDCSPFKAIARELGRDPSTISKEVRGHRVPKKSGALGKAFYICAHRFGCDCRRLCTGCKNNRYCWTCGKCISICPDYKEQKCSRLSSPPYVCNGCQNLNSCTLEKWFYRAQSAQEEYKSLLSEAREGISLSEDEIRHLDSIISPLILKGQSLNHIFQNHGDSIMVSESTLYRLINDNLFTARNLDLPRRVRFSKRKCRKNRKIDKQCRTGRTYLDYQVYIQEHPDLPVTQIDSVEGVKGGKVLLTIHFVQAEFMAAFLRDTNDSQSVIDIFNRLYLELRCDIFISLMPVLLADNGSEFSNPSRIEFDTQGNQRTHLFYCDPASPGQKGSAERNHELIRLVIPKGKPLDSYTQDDISLMMSHINSYCRPSLGNKTPYDMMCFLYGKGIPERFGIHKIAPDDVTLRPSLLAKGDDKDE